MIRPILFAACLAATSASAQTYEAIWQPSGEPDQYVLGDFNGDGETDAAVYYAAASHWVGIKFGLREPATLVNQFTAIDTIATWRGANINSRSADGLFIQYSMGLGQLYSHPVEGAAPGLITEPTVVNGTEWTHTGASHYRIIYLEPIPGTNPVQYAETGTVGAASVFACAQTCTHDLPAAAVTVVNVCTQDSQGGDPLLCAFD